MINPLIANLVGQVSTEQDDNLHEFIAEDAASARAKLADAMVPGYEAEFDPAEAEAAGAFAEDALSEADAIASTEDSVVVQPVAPRLEP
jgi:hypothetical protein